MARGEGLGYYSDNSGSFEATFEVAGDLVAPGFKHVFLVTWNATGKSLHARNFGGRVVPLSGSIPSAEMGSAHRLL